MSSEPAKNKELTAEQIHQKKLNRRGQQMILAVLVAALITIFLLSSIEKVMPGLLSFPGKPVYSKSLYGSEKKVILDRPLGLDISKSGRCYVSDMGNGRIVVFDEDGKLLFDFGQKYLKIPVYLALDSMDNVYVTDRVLRKVIIFDKNGRYLGDFSSSKIRNPLGIFIDGKDNIYVSDVGKRHCIHVLDSEGNILMTFGETKKVVMAHQDEGKFYFPNGIFVDNDGNIYVADSNNHRVQVFNKFGEPDSIIAMGGLPRGVVVREQNNRKVIYVIDTIDHKISAYDTEGKHLVSFSKQGRNNDELMYPSSIALDKKGKLFITDRNNGRVQVFDTFLDINNLAKMLMPYLPLVSLPWLFLLLGLLYSRKKRYVTSTCFLENLLDQEELDRFLGSVKGFYVTESCHDKLKLSKLTESFQGKINTRPHDERFAAKLMEDYKLSKHQAEILALAHHKGLFHPVLLARDKNLVATAKIFGIDVMDFKEFIKRTEEKKR